MGKTRKTITIDSELAEIVDERDEFNLSGFVNACLEQHFAGDDVTTPKQSAVQAQIEEIEEELDEAEQKRERLRKKRERLESKMEDMEDEPELMAQAREKLKHTPKDPDNPAVQNWASKLGIASDELVSKLEADQ
jgi:septal ring factor EnvC (AmiA/AmiB activator)